MWFPLASVMALRCCPIATGDSGRDLRVNLRGAFEGREMSDGFPRLLPGETKFVETLGIFRPTVRWSMRTSCGHGSLRSSVIIAITV